MSLKTTKKVFAYQALAFKVVWHTPLKTFKGGDPNNAFHLTALFFPLLFMNESFGYLKPCESGKKKKKGG